MPMLRKLRLIAAIVLVCAIVLPLSECSQTGNSSVPVTTSISQQLFPRDNAKFTYWYGFEYLWHWFYGPITILAFAWPLMLLLSVRRRIGSRFRLFLQLLELLLCAGTIYWVNTLTQGGRWLYGAYASVISAAVFSFAGLASWFVGTKRVAEERV